MKTDKKILKSATIIAGALMTTSLAAAPGMSPDILAYNDLGSGAEVRSHLIDQNVNQVNGAESTAYKFGELKCGEGKCGEGKCGEGDKKKEAKKEDAKKSESQTADTKKSDTKKETKKKKKK
ncbi:MAG: hypothetical protein ABFS28_15185 [Bacteroidota bacterium]